MGFRSGAYATIWSTESISDTLTKARLSVSRKDKRTDEYVTDFSGFVTFAGSAAARKASYLKERDRIRFGDVDVTNKYDKEKNVTYTNFWVYSFDTQDEIDDPKEKPQTVRAAVDDGEIEDGGLPF